MADFAPAFAWMIPHEDVSMSGVVTEEPNGGIAKFGINSVDFPGVDVRNLSLDGAKQIYLSTFWTPYPGYAQIQDQGVANKIFDTSVNVGPHRAFEFLHQALTTIGYTLPEPARLDAATISAVNAEEPHFLLLMYRYYQMTFYIEDSKQSPAKHAWLKNWMWRASK